jgi:hypothetical protein
MKFTNFTAFSADSFAAIDQYDVGFEVIAARVTYDLNIGRDGKCEIVFSDEQAPLCAGDLHAATPGYSSVLVESDYAPFKPLTDIVVNAQAFSPHNKPTKVFAVGLRVGSLEKTLHIHGARFWRKRVGDWELSDPENLVSLPVRYEFAVGGVVGEGDRALFAPVNPAGCGWYDREMLKTVGNDVLRAPQIDSITQQVTRIDGSALPEGFGFWGRGWPKRIEYSGTADNAWLANRHPLLPQNFDMRYWNGAHPDLRIPHPSDDVEITLQNLISADDAPSQSLKVIVPLETLFAYITTIHGVGIAKDLTLDTMLLDIPARRLSCTYRTSIVEILEADAAELRYIPKGERAAERERAVMAIIAKDEPMFVPIPPSIARMTPNKNGKMTYEVRRG